MKAKVPVLRQFLQEEFLSHWIGQVSQFHNDYYKFHSVI
jgi:hypothetical protein